MPEMWLLGIVSSSIFLAIGLSLKVAELSHSLKLSNEENTKFKKQIEKHEEIKSLPIKTNEESNIVVLKQEIAVLKSRLEQSEEQRLILEKQIIEREARIDINTDKINILQILANSIEGIEIKQIAQELNMDIVKVNHHSTELEKLKMVKSVRVKKQTINKNEAGQQISITNSTEAGYKIEPEGNKYIVEHNLA